MPEIDTPTNGNVELKVYKGRSFRRAFWYVWPLRGDAPADLTGAVPRMHVRDKPSASGTLLLELVGGRLAVTPPLQTTAQAAIGASVLQVQPIPCEIPAGKVLAFGDVHVVVKARSMPGATQLELAAPLKSPISANAVAPLGRIEAVLTKAETAALTFSRGYWDIEITLPSGDELEPRLAGYMNVYPEGITHD